LETIETETNSENKPVKEKLKNTQENTPEELKDIPIYKRKLHLERKEKILKWVNNINKEVKDITKSWEDRSLIFEIISFYEPKLTLEKSTNDLDSILKELNVTIEVPSEWDTEGKTIDFLNKLCTKFTQQEYASILLRRKVEENKKIREKVNLENVVSKINDLSIENPEDILKSLNELYLDNNETNWVLLGFNQPNSISLINKGKLKNK
jgi:hypothetical protein